MSGGDTRRQPKIRARRRPKIKAVLLFCVGALSFLRQDSGLRHQERNGDSTYPTDACEQSESKGGSIERPFSFHSLLTGSVS